MNKAKLIRHVRVEIAFTRAVIWTMEHPASMASAERDRTAHRLRQRIKGLELEIAELRSNED